MANRSNGGGGGTSVATTQINTLNTFLKSNLRKVEDSLAHHMDAARLARVALVAIQKQPKLLKCTKESVFMALLEAGQLGLEPSGVMGGGYLVPYGTECVFIPGYRGLVDLVRRIGEVGKVDAHCVYAGEHFKYTLGLTPHLEHEPAGDPAIMVPKNLTHVYTVFTYRADQYGHVVPPRFVVMTRAQVEAIRKRSKAAGNGPWVTDYEWMSKKTVIRQGVKLERMTPQMESTIARSDAVDAGLDLPPSFVADDDQAAETVAATVVSTKPAKSKSERMAEKVSGQDSDASSDTEPLTDGEKRKYAGCMDHAHLLSFDDRRTAEEAGKSMEPDAVRAAIRMIEKARLEAAGSDE